MKTIGLMGLTFSNDNKGCMALAFSFAEILEKHFDLHKTKVIIFSFDNYDKKYIELFFPVSQFSIISLKNISSLLCAMKDMAKCDIIFDFTEGDSFSDIYGIKRFIKISIEKSMAIANCKRYILCPQTYGPYKSKLSKVIAKRIIWKALLVLARDKTSAEYVETLTGRKTETFTDIAFSLKADKTIMSLVSSAKKKKIGINVSALLWNGGYNGKNQFGLKLDYRKYIYEIIRQCINEMQFEVHLIPHVYSSDLLDSSVENDYYICEKIKKDFPDCIVPICYDRPDQIKGYISTMDCFIGSRMHATIAAFSMGIPTIPVSYSRKFEGLYEALGYPYVIHATTYDLNDAILKTVDFLHDINPLKVAQKKALDLIQTKLQAFELELSHIVSSTYQE